MKHYNFIQMSDHVFANIQYEDSLRKTGLTTIDSVFEFQEGENLTKSNLAEHRTRIRFTLKDNNKALFLKRYDHTPKLVQIKNWFSHMMRVSTADYDRLPGQILADAGIKTPPIVAYGCQWKGLFEERSFVITEKIPNAESLERKLPDFCSMYREGDNLKMFREFVNSLADFTKRFHDTGFCHRDFYLCHIFYDSEKQFHLIDLQRTFKPNLLRKRFQIKDISQLHYSAPGNIFSDTDRLRFYLRYTGRKKLSTSDKRFISKLKARAWRMADHDIKHGRNVPFAM